MVKLIEPIIDKGDPHLMKEFYLLAVEFDVSKEYDHFEHQLVVDCFNKYISLFFIARFSITPANQLMLKYVDFLISKVSEGTEEHVTIRHSDIGFFLYMSPNVSLEK